MSARCTDGLSKRCTEASTRPRVCSGWIQSPKHFAEEAQASLEKPCRLARLAHQKKFGGQKYVLLRKECILHHGLFKGRILSDMT